MSREFGAASVKLYIRIRGGDDAGGREHGRLADAYIRIYVYKFAGIWPEVIEIYECQMVSGGRRLSRGTPHDGLAGDSLSRLRDKSMGGRR